MEFEDRPAIDESLVEPEEASMVIAQEEYVKAKQTVVGNILANTLLVAGVAGMMALALSREQRIAIREGRDCGECQFPHPYGDECQGNLQVHHIRPQRYLKDKGYTEDQIDVPENLLTVCEHAHHDHIHLDMKKAKRNYYRNKNSYKEVFAAREQVLQDGRPYWNTAYDKAMKMIAQSRTIHAMREGWEYPLKGKNGKG